MARSIDVGDQIAAGEIPTAVAEAASQAPAIADIEAATQDDPDVADSSPAVPTAAPITDASSAPTAVPTATPSAPEPTATATPTPAPQPDSDSEPAPESNDAPQPDSDSEPPPESNDAPQPDSDSEPPPESNDAPQPDSDSEPPPELDPRNTRALPDGDSERSPQIIALDGPRVVSGAVSVGHDDADYLRFVSATDQKLVGVTVGFACENVELDDQSSIAAEGWQDDHFDGYGACTASGPAFTWTAYNLDGNYPFMIELGARDAVFDTLDRSAYDHENGFAPYGGYQVTVTPTFADVATYKTATTDGDGPNNPTGRVPNVVENSVSAPDGDSEDWFRFTGSELLESDNREFDPKEPETFVNIYCDNLQGDESALVVATLYDAKTTDVLAQFACFGDQDYEFVGVEIEPDTTYMLQVEMSGTGSVTYGWGFLGP